MGASRGGIRTWRVVVPLVLIGAVGWARVMDRRQRTESPTVPAPSQPLQYGPGSARGSIAIGHTRDEVLLVAPAVRWRGLLLWVLLVALALLSVQAWRLRPIEAPTAISDDPGSVSLLVLNPITNGKVVQTSSSLTVRARIAGTDKSAQHVQACAGSSYVADARPLSVEIFFDVRVPTEALPAGEYYLFQDFAVVLAGNARFRDPQATAGSMEKQLNMDLPHGKHASVVVRNKVLSLDGRSERVQVLAGILPVYVPASLRLGIGRSALLTGQICGSGVRRSDYWTVGRLPGTSDQLVDLTSSQSIVSAESPVLSSSTRDFTMWNKMAQSVSVSFDPNLDDYDVRAAHPVPDVDDASAVTWKEKASYTGPRFRIVDLNRETVAANGVFWAGLMLGIAGSVLLVIVQEVMQWLRNREHLASD